MIPEKQLSSNHMLFVAAVLNPLALAVFITTMIKVL
jgi:hypothetical protein